MRRPCTLLLILLTLVLTGLTTTSYARRWYMAPDGNDNNNGSITSPWKTLTRVWNSIAAGDTVYLRGGTYAFNTAQYLQGKNGTATNRINIWAYPGEKPNLTRSSTYNATTQQDLIYFEGNAFHWKGIEISWFDQKPGDYAWPAFRAGFTSNSIFEQIDYHHNGAGMSIRGNSNNNLFLNCDFHHNQDPYSDSPFDGADGIDLHYIAAGNSNTLRNCRAWWNADDGFDCWDNNGYMLIENCWSFYNGYIPGTFNVAGNGSGIKLGSTANAPNTLLRTVQNCVVFKNRSYGIVENAAICKSNIFNNTVVQSGDYGFWFGSWGTNVATLRNNIGWNNPQNARLSVHDIHDHNSWNGGVTTNAQDFQSMDDAQLLQPRKPDGSLPDLTFLMLVPNSDLVDAGVNVGLPFNAAAPDITAKESGGATPPPGNLPPIANAGPDQNVILPLAIVTLNGSGFDPDGSIASYQWTKISGPGAITIVTPLLAVTLITGLTQGSYEFELVVVDNQGAVGRDTMTVDVTPLIPLNQPPVANAGPNQNITLPLNSITVNGTGTDPDGTVVTYAWRKVAGPGTFNIVSPGSPTTVINNLVQGTYRFELRVTDNEGAFDRDTMRVIVNAGPPNQLPTASAGPDHNITLPVNTITATGGGNDPDGTINSYHWQKITGPTQFTIVSPNQAQSVVNNLVQGTYTFSMTVMDNNGGVAADTMTVVVNAAPPPPNQLPNANAGPDHTITLPVNTVTVTGSGTDPDGTISAYQWTKISGPATFTIVSPTQAQTVINNVVQGTYRFELRVTDNQGGIDRDTMTLIVNAPVNQLPVANAGPDHTITLPVNSVSANGSGIDPDGIITAYQWTKLTGPAQFTILFPAQPQTVINNLVQGTYTFELRVTDNQGAIGRDTMTVVVNPTLPPVNQLPTANAGGNHTITLPVNSVAATGSGSDPDGTITAYQWTKLSGPAQFNILFPTQAQTVIDNLVEGVYQFELRVTDNDGAFGRDTMTVTVNPEGTPPNQDPIANAGPDHTITLPVNTVTAMGSGTDPDGTIASYEWVKISGPGQFTILFPTQAQTVINNMVQGVYQFELRVTDNLGAIDRDTMRVTVNAAVPPPNQLPVANAGPDHSITLPTNTITAMGSGTDPDGIITAYQWTKISGPSQFTILFPTQPQTVINNLVQGVYEFQLRVTDNAGAIDLDTMVVTVAPPPNQLPVADAGTDKVITLPANSITQVGSGTDPDGTIVSYQWSRVSGPSQYVIISPLLPTTVINNVVQGVYRFELLVTDNNGATDRDTMTLTVLPPLPPNQVPVANAGPDMTITLPVNTVTALGSGLDPDGTIAGYQWTKLTGPAQFTIMFPTQPQTVINNLVQGTYTFELRVTDNQGAIDRDTMSVTVNPALPPPPNQAPVANAGANHTITLPVNSVTALGSGTDPDGTVVSYLWTKLTGPAPFAILFPAQPQTVISNMVQGVYSFELRVIDNQGAIDRDTMTVTVLPAPPPPNQGPNADAGANHTITLPVNSITALGSGTDPNGTITSYQWTKLTGPSQYTIVFPTQAHTMINNLVEGIYTFELRVIDNQGAIDRDTMMVTVLPAPNQGPVANAGPDSTITLPVNQVVIAGSGTDPDGTIVSYAWSYVSGPSQYTISDPGMAQTEFRDLVQGEYAFELLVTDNDGATDRDTVVIKVNQNQSSASTAMLYPNPATDNINVRIEAVTYANKTLIQVMNISGMIVYQKEVMRTQQLVVIPLDVTSLPRGAYFVKVGLDLNNAITLPFIKQ